MRVRVAATVPVVPADEPVARGHFPGGRREAALPGCSVSWPRVGNIGVTRSTFECNPIVMVVILDERRPTNQADRRVP